MQPQPNVPQGSVIATWRLPRLQAPFVARNKYGLQNRLLRGNFLTYEGCRLILMHNKIPECGSFIRAKEKLFRRHKPWRKKVICDFFALTA